MTRASAPSDAPPIDLKALVRSTFLAPSGFPDIVTFAEHPTFIGDGGPGLLPRQRTARRLFFGDREQMTAYDEDVIEGWRTSFYDDPELRVGVPFDVWDRIAWLKSNGRRRFNTILFIGGRRGGKGHLGAIIAAYEFAWLLSLGDPQAHLGIARGHPLVTMVTATEYRQAREAQFADIARLVRNGRVFRNRIAMPSRSEIAILTDADAKRSAEAGVKDDRGLALEASLRARAFSSNANAGRGITANALYFDEFAHHLVTDDGSSAEEVYRALAPSLAQMHEEALTYIPTSPWSRTSYAYKLYEDVLATDDDGAAMNPDMLVLQASSAELYLDDQDRDATKGRVFTNVPFRMDDDQRRAQARDPRGFRTEVLAQWAEGEDTYLDPGDVDRLFAPICPQHAGSLLDDGGCSVCGGLGVVPSLSRTGETMVRYRGHADPGVTDSNFAAAVGHYEYRDDPEGEPTVHEFIDYATVWRSEDYRDHRIPYHEVQEDLVRLITGFQWMESFTIDQFGAFATVPQLTARLKEGRHRVRIRERTHTASEGLERWETFKVALSEGLVHMFRDDLGRNGTSLAAAELKALQYRNGRVSKPKSGPIRTNDLARRDLRSGRRTAPGRLAPNPCQERALERAPDRGDALLRRDGDTWSTRGPPQPLRAPTSESLRAKGSGRLIHGSRSRFAPAKVPRATSRIVTDLDTHQSLGPGGARGW